MRIALALALSLLATPVLAGAAEDGKALYAVTGEAAALFTGLLERAPAEPAVAALAMKDEVSRPLSRADDAFMAALAAGDVQAYAPFLPCRSAAVSLGAVADGYAAWLGGRGDRPDVDLDIGYFREDFTRCELALDLPVTFAEVAATLSR
jgi:hypothetical protein